MFKFHNSSKIKYQQVPTNPLILTFLQRFECSCTHFEAIIFSVNVLFLRIYGKYDCLKMGAAAIETLRSKIFIVNFIIIIIINLFKVDKIAIFYKK